ncbi:putative uncharacterized protein [Aliivibrio wodanis]|uniref:Uncharacterized protein n=1 Tax=Aliivibrio wodanis TaxID=80852 RepID=A0A090IR17_9GAMM|nr:putative uncharacterized protein [Aliivibrio wodanis]
MEENTGLRSQVGCIPFKISSKLLVDTNPQILMELSDFPHYIQLSINDKKQLVYRHTIPSAMTRVIELDLDTIIFEWDESFISLSWGRDGLRITLQPCGKRSPFFIREGNDKSSEQIRLTSDGKVFYLGANSSGFHMHQEGDYTSKPFALEHWENTKEYIHILLTGESESSYMYESALSNLLLVSLVTGLETYLKTRFIELYKEGVELDLNTLVKQFSKREERANDAKLLISDDSLIKYTSKKINFQNYQHIKAAYKSFGIPLHEHISNTLIEKVKMLISFRHKIIHYSISLGLLNVGDYGAEPIFPNKALIESSIKEFDDFVTQIHSASLKN